METISFTEAIKMVHPDSNPSIEDAGVKVRTIMQYKNEPQTMMRFLKQWGLIGNVKSKSKSTSTTIRYFTHLKMNHYYYGEVSMIHKRYPGVVFKILRTTNKRVYFMPNEKNMKFCNEGSIKYVFIEKEETI